MTLSRTDVEIKAAFDKASLERSYLEHRWLDYSGWTLPYLFPHDEYYSTIEMQNDYQSLGAQGVNHLANKIVMTLFPPSRPFFKIELTPDVTQALDEMDFSAGDIDVFTSRAEREAMKNMEKVKLRTAVIQAIKHLIVLGNALVYYPKNLGKPTQVYNLRDYTIKRDMSGEVIQILTRDRKHMDTLPTKIRDMVEGGSPHSDDRIDIYTSITLTKENNFFVKQELEDMFVIPETFSTYPKDRMPWSALTWNLVRGQDYGNGLVEEYSGDLHVYSSMSESQLELAAIASDIKILVNPMGQTDVDTLNSSKPGTYVYGLPTDVAYLQLEKMAELSFVDHIMETYQRRISSAFLLGTQVTRDAERVTAEEIRMQTNELESSLGGVYSRLAEDMQQPLAMRLLESVHPDLAALNPQILTGVESLSRNSEHEQMILYINDLAMMANIPEPMHQFVKWEDFAKVLASNRGLEYTKFVKDSDEVEEDTQQGINENAQNELGAALGAGLGANMAGGT